MTNLNDRQQALEIEFSNHIMWEFPQIDPCTRGALAYELSLIAVSNFPVE